MNYIGDALKGASLLSWNASFLYSSKEVQILENDKMYKLNEKINDAPHLRIILSFVKKFVKFIVDFYEIFAYTKIRKGAILCRILSLFLIYVTMVKCCVM